MKGMWRQDEAEELANRLEREGFGQLDKEDAECIICALRFYAKAKEDVM